MTARRRRLVVDIAAPCPCRSNRSWQSDVRSVWLQKIVLKLHVFDAWVIAFPAHALLPFQGSTHLWITSATHAARFRPMWGTIPPPLGHDYGKWDTIPLLPEKCPTSQRNPAPHRSGMLPHFKRNQCPTSTGIHTPSLRTGPVGCAAMPHD